MSSEQIALPDRTNCVRLLRMMREIRQFEERIITLYPTDVMVTPVHLHIGQEAAPVGVCAHLTPADTIFFTHRTHGPALAKGLSMRKLMAELYGRTTGCSRGYGGSMHVVDPEHGMLGSSSIVGGGIAMGVGSALASKQMGRDWISVSYFGDGATDAGIFWESLNFAALKSVPVLFLCENNQLSNVMPKSEHLSVELANAAGAFMPASSVDGTDVLAVHEAAGRAIRRVREEKRPVFLECRTKRWMKHQGIERDDLPWNPVDREKDCPIRKLEQRLSEAGWMTAETIHDMARGIEKQIDDAVEFARQSPFPAEDELIREV